jgi:hypothetical protein
MKSCEWCQEDVVSVVPVVNRDFASSWEHGHCFICTTCAELAVSEGALWEIPLFTEPRRKARHFVGRPMEESYWLEFADYSQLASLSASVR